MLLSNFCRRQSKINYYGIEKESYKSEENNNEFVSDDDVEQPRQSQLALKDAKRLHDYHRNKIIEFATSFL